MVAVRRARHETEAEVIMRCETVDNEAFWFDDRGLYRLAGEVGEETVEPAAWRTVAAVPALPAVGQPWFVPVEVAEGGALVCRRLGVVSSISVLGGIAAA